MAAALTGSDTGALPTPEVTAIGVRALLPGHFAQVHISCPRCDSSRTRIEWRIDDTVVGRGPRWEVNYPAHVATPTVTVRVIPVSAHGIEGTPQTTTYRDQSRKHAINLYAIALSRNDGTVISAGWEGWPSEHVRVFPTEERVEIVVPSGSAFAGLTADGRVTSWGDRYAGGIIPSALRPAARDVLDITASAGAFAALRKNGHVIAWGDKELGGNANSVSAQLRDVQAVRSTRGAFAALTHAGRVVSWGDAHSGGALRPLHKDRLNAGVQALASIGNAFAALRGNGSAVSWGDLWQDDSASTPQVHVQEGVTRLMGDPTAALRAWHGFLALDAAGNVLSWGGAAPPARHARSDQAPPIRTVTANLGAFAAIDAHGAVATWGVSENGGDSSAVARHLQRDVLSVAATPTAFAALRSDGSVVSWGDPDAGGDSAAVAAHLRRGVVAVFANDWAFAALKDDGSVVSWGSADAGGNSHAVADQLRDGVMAVYPGMLYFVAIKNDGRAVAWGAPLAEVIAANRAHGLAPPWARLSGTAPEI